MTRGGAILGRNRKRQEWPRFRVLLPLAGLVLASLLPRLALSEEAWRGVDLSYVNEMEDCGAVYRVGREVTDPYRLFADAGANIVRLRLWHTPDWTRYGTFDDVKKSMRRARQNGMRILLDFHYSDDWAHPGKQLVPAAWADTEDTEALAKRLHGYTLAVLRELARDGLLPEFVQVGNEINTELLLTKVVPEDSPINWQRNIALLNAGISAVRAASSDAARPPGVMLHIAQPENVEPWFDAALQFGLMDFDLIGISYYPRWSEMPFHNMRNAIRHFRNKYQKEIVVVETAYPWTLEGRDAAANILGEDSLVHGYPATPDGQRRFMLELMAAVLESGGLGVVYWEPAWVATSCATRWGHGSHWENATLFDYENVQLLEGADFLQPRALPGRSE